MSAAIKSCPFCGSKDIVKRRNGISWYVACSECHSGFSCVENPGGIWTRPLEETLVAQVEELKWQVEELRTQRWHKWPDKVPAQTNEYYLVCLKSGRIEKAVYFGLKIATLPAWKIAGRGTSISKLVAYWMLSPPPPQEEEKNH